jgi:uncharacterized RmlC-like cupin family protein
VVARDTGYTWATFGGGVLFIQSLSLQRVTPTVKAAMHRFSFFIIVIYVLSGRVVTHRLKYGNHSLERMTPLLFSSLLLL